MPKVTKEFDKAAYDREYHKKNYKNISIVMKLDAAEKLESAAKKAGVTKSAFINVAIDEKIERDSNA